MKAIAYIFCAKCLPLQSVCSWVHSSKTNFEIWGSNCIVSQGNSLQNKSGLKRQKSSPNLPVPGQISTEFHGSSLSFCLDNRCRTDYEESICATQKESTVLQNHCSLPCFLYSVWPITYKCLHCKLSDCWLTTCWVCCSLRTSGLPTLSPTSYTHITALHIFIWHLKQALHYLENSFVQKWWHASTFDIFQHFCLVYMLPKWEIFFFFAWHAWIFSNLVVYDRMKTISSWVPIVKHVFFSLVKNSFCWAMRSMVFIYNFD